MRRRTNLRLVCLGLQGALGIGTGHMFRIFVAPKFLVNEGVNFRGVAWPLRADSSELGCVPRTSNPADDGSCKSKPFCEKHINIDCRAPPPSLALTNVRK